MIGERSLKKFVLAFSYLIIIFGIYAALNEYKFLFYKDFVKELVLFYSQDLSSLENYNPLSEYNISLSDLPKDTCSFVVEKINIPFYENLGNSVRDKAMLHVCSQIIYDLYISAVDEVGEEYNKSVAEYCIKNYLENHKAFLLKLDNTPIVICLLEK